MKGMAGPPLNTERRTLPVTRYALPVTRHRICGSFPLVAFVAFHMTELVAVETVVRGAAERHHELAGQIETLGKGVLLRLCELAVQDPEPNATHLNPPDFGRHLAGSQTVVRTVFDVAILARVALEIAKASLADAAKLAGQLKLERERRALDYVTDDHVKAIAASAVELRKSHPQITQST